MKRSLITLALLIPLFFLAYTFLLKKPLQKANWMEQYKVLPQITIDRGLVSVRNIRNFRFTAEDNPEIIAYTSTIFDAAKVKRIWYVVQPFEKTPQIAHTFFIFDFSDGKSLVVTAEARKRLARNTA